MQDCLSLKMSKDPVSQDILELLAMSIFADKQILSEEIEAFVDAVLSFQKDQILNTDLSEAEIIIWYEHHKAYLREIVTGKKFEPWINDRIKALEAFPDKQRLLRAMNDIALSDGEQHVSERALEILTARKWAQAMIEAYAISKS